VFRPQSVIIRVTIYKIFKNHVVAFAITHFSKYSYIYIYFFLNVFSIFSLMLNP